VSPGIITPVDRFTEAVSTEAALRVELDEMRREIAALREEIARATPTPRRSRKRQ
jgi:hypothetical protein